MYQSFFIEETPSGASDAAEAVRVNAWRSQPKRRSYPFFYAELSRARQRASSFYGAQYIVLVSEQTGEPDVVG